MKNDIDATIKKIEDDLQENAEADWIPGAAPTQHCPNRLSLMLAPVEQTPDFIEECWANLPRLTLPTSGLYFEAECQDCDWEIGRMNAWFCVNWLIDNACSHATESAHDVSYTISAEGESESHLIEGKPKGFWDKLIEALSTNKGKFIAAICMSVPLNMTIDYFWEIERGRGSMIIGFFSAGLCYWGFCCITALWRKRKERNID